MSARIQLPLHQIRPSNISEFGIYVLQMPNAIEAGYPSEWKYSHKEWIAVEEQGLIKIGVTASDVEIRIAAILRSAEGLYWEVDKSLSFPEIDYVGFSRTSYFRTYERWIHQTLHNYRIPKECMYDLGREWFIPTQEVIAFIKDVFEQLQGLSSKIEEHKQGFSRLARIRQAHFGGMLVEPSIQKGDNIYFRKWQ